MRTFLSICGILLIIFGIVALGYEGFTYHKHEKVAQIGDVEISTSKEHTIYFPPYLGGASLAAGLALVVISRIGKK